MIPCNSFILQKNIDINTEVGAAGRNPVAYPCHHLHPANVTFTRFIAFIYFESMLFKLWCLNDIFTVEFGYQINVN